MRTFLAVVLLLATALAGGQCVALAAPQVVECPSVAPSTWGLAPNPRLSGVNILSAPKGTRIDDSAPPSLMPDTQDTYNRTLHQTWQMNADGPDWSYFVDCHYAGTQRFLRLDAAGMTRCDYSVTPFSTTDKSDAAQHSLVCR
jgi:hypothetical protein